MTHADISISQIYLSILRTLNASQTNLCGRPDYDQLCGVLEAVYYVKIDGTGACTHRDPVGGSLSIRTANFLFPGCLVCGAVMPPSRKKTP